MLDADKVNFYLADEPPTVVQLKIKPHFEALSEQEKLYAHYISVYVTINLHSCRCVTFL